MQESLIFLGPAYSQFHIKFPMKLGFQTQSPNLLSWREDYHDGKNYSIDSRGKLKTDELSSPLSVGYTNSTFRVLNWMDIPGGKFPKQMEFISFGLNASRRKAEPIIVSSALISTVKTEAFDYSFSPETKPNTTVRDSRKSVTGFDRSVNYFSKDGGILQTSNEIAAVVHKIKPGSSSSRGLAVKTPTVRIAALAVIAASTLGFGIFLLRRTRQRD